MAFTLRSIAEVELARFKVSPTATAYLDQAVDLLKSCGVVALLRVFARPFSNDGGESVTKAAYTAAFCEGYNTALDQLMSFKEMYLNEELGRRPVTADFGALALAVSRGDLTKEDVEKLNGKRK